MLDSAKVSPISKYQSARFVKVAETDCLALFNFLRSSQSEVYILQRECYCGLCGCQKSAIGRNVEGRHEKQNGGNE
jgi:hypothetical protein